MTFDALWKGRTYLNHTTYLCRDPFTVGSIILGGAGLSAAALATAAGTLAATAVGYLVTTVVTSYVLAALAPKTGSASVGATGTTVNTQDAAAPHHYVYGTIRKGGNITYLNSTGTDNKFLHVILCLAGHELESIDDIYVNDEVVTLDANGFVTSHGWNSKIRIKKHLGSTTQTVDTDLQAEVSTLPASFRGRGIAYLYIRLEFDNAVFSRGMPLFTAKVKGKKVYDPRNGLTQWSDNAALCIRDYLASDYGGNVPNEVDDTWFGAQATLCDQLITLPDTTTTKKFVCNGIISADMSRREALTRLISACSGDLFYSTGLFKLVVGTYTAPVKSFTAKDLRGPISIEPRVSRRNNFNTVVGIFNDAAQDYIETDYPAVTDAAFVTEDDGVETVLDLPLPFTTNVGVANFLAKLTLYRMREQITVQAPFSLKALELDIGDNITLTLSKYGWTNKEFQVVGWGLEIVQSDNGASALQVNLSLKETSSTVFSQNPSAQVILHNNSTLPSPSAVIVPTGLAASNTGFVASDGTYLPGIDFSWTNPASPYQKLYLVSWKKAADSNWQSVTIPTNRYQIQNVTTGVLYNLKVAAINVFNVESTEATLNFTPGQDTTAPAVPVWVSADGIPGGVSLQWTNPPDADFKHVELYEGTSTSFASATKIADLAGSAFTRTNLAAGTTYYYWLKAVDYSGNISTQSTRTNATAQYIDNGDFQNGIDAYLQTLGITVPSVVSVLPTTGNYTGRLVFLTTDKKLYRYDGTAWVASVPTTDLTGTLQLSSFANTLRPVEVLAALPSTGNFQGRIVFLTTDNKTYRYDGSNWINLVTNDDVSVLVTNLVNPVSVTGTLNGWGPVDQNGNGSSAQLAYNATENAMELISSAQHTVRCISWKVNHDKIYRVSFKVRKNTIHGDIRAGVIANATAFSGLVGTTAQNGDQNVVPYDSARVAQAAAFNSWYIDGAVTGTSYVEVVGYIVGKNRSVNDCPGITGTFAGSTYPICKLQAGTNFVGIKFGNWTNTISTSLYIQDVSVQEVASGQVVNENIADAALSLAKFAAGIRPVEIVSSLPVTGNVQGRTVFLTTDNKIYRYNGTAFTVATDGNDIIAGSIVAGKIAAGAISATEIAAGAILASKMVISDTSNLYPDFDLLDAGMLSTPDGATWALNTSAASSTGRQYISITADASARTVVTSWLPLEADTDFSVSGVAWVNPGGAGTGTATLSIELGSVTGAGVVTSTRTIAVDTAVDSSSSAAGTVNILTTSTERRFRFVCVRSAGGTSQARFGGFRVVRRANGNLIVDGAITAAKIAANAITAAQIAAGTITATELAANSIIAGKIAAGVISATELAANSITASKIVLTDATNLYPDYDILDTAFYASSTGATYTLPTITQAAIGRAVIQINSNASAMQVESGWFPVEVSADYLVAASAWTTTSTAGSGTASTIIELGSVDSAGVVTPLRQLTVVSRTDSSTQTNASISLTTASNERRARFIALRAAGGTANSRHGGFRIQRKANANLVVDGSITTAKLAAGAVTANELAANSVVAGKIAAGVIAAADINTTSFAASGVGIFGGTLKSSNYVAGTAGWQITNAGAAEFNSLQVRQDMIVAGAVSKQHVKMGTGSTVTISATTFATRQDIIASYTTGVNFLSQASGGGDLFYSFTLKLAKAAATNAAQLNLCFEYYDGAAWQFVPLDIDVGAIKLCIPSQFGTERTMMSFQSTATATQVSGSTSFRLSAYKTNTAPFTESIDIDEVMISVHQLNR